MMAVLVSALARGRGSVALVSGLAVTQGHGLVQMVAVVEAVPVPVPVAVGMPLTPGQGLLDV